MPPECGERVMVGRGNILPAVLIGLADVDEDGSLVHQRKGVCGGEMFQ
jgi:hypothetical protein